MANEHYSREVVSILVFINLAAISNSRDEAARMIKERLSTVPATVLREVTRAQGQLWALTEHQRRKKAHTQQEGKTA